MRNFFYLNTRAQAILELAIFGAILIMLLGALINYGLRYNYQQQVAQETFRKALYSASQSTQNNTPVSTTEIVIRDKHIPDPSNPFGVGQVVPIYSSAGVTRNPTMQKTPDNDAEAARLNIRINNDTRSYRTAGARIERGVPSDQLDTYNYIFGNYNIEKLNAPEGNQNCKSVGWYDIRGAKCNAGEEGCGERIKCEDGKTYSMPEAYKIKITDPCEGEIFDYNTANAQCMQIIDKKYCTDTCQKNKSEDSDIDCAKVCSYQINIPWYCRGYRQEGGEYKFPALEKIFPYNQKSNLGLQPAYKQVFEIKENKLEKKETSTGVTATDTMDWQVKTDRTIKKVTGKTTSEETVTSTYEPKLKTKTWQANW